MKGRLKILAAFGPAHLPVHHLRLGERNWAGKRDLAESSLRISVVKQYIQ